MSTPPPTLIRLTQAVSILISALASGSSIALSTLLIPRLLESPTPLMLRQWTNSYNVTKLIFPFLGNLSTVLYLTLAGHYHTRLSAGTKGTLYLAAGALCLSVTPYTWAFVIPLNKRILHKAEEMRGLNQPHIQRPFLIQQVHPLRRPILTILHQLHIKVEHQPSQAQPRLHQRQAAPDTIPLAKAERLKHLPVVTSIPLRAVIQPPLRDKLPRVRKVLFEVEGRPVRDLQDGPLSDELPVNQGAALRDEAVDPCGEGRVDPQGLVDDSQEVRHLRDGGISHLLLVREAPPYLLPQPGQLGRVPEQVVHRHGQQRGARLAAGHQEDLAVCVQLLPRDAAGLVDLGQDAADYVWPVCLAREPPVDFVSCGLGVRVRLGHDFPRHYGLDEGAQEAHGRDHLRVHHVGEVGEDEGDPGVELAPANAVKGFAEGEVANDVL
ncbi:hypothetical protein VP1G_10924 [Cytospora mali]|uniref:Uncharacterized protein n=1 Tax=Cytospora mali TaxID=578113 RepID=A0A194UZV0_CYTMA|nr:hypothetical protein VP1G_10924 [Valsa mali var. pyri (nom. inval.)]